MADLTNPILSVRTTVGSRLAELEVTDGQLTFIRDKHQVILDFDGKRTVYNQIQELATDGARTSMLAPVTGIYYFVVETSVLWTYLNGWVQITTSPAQMTKLVDAALVEAKASGDFKGDKGDPGVSGVYVGSGDMPEGYNVQIDPDGDLSMIPVRGVDYWTETDKTEIISDVLAALPIYNGEVIEL